MPLFAAVRVISEYSDYLLTTLEYGQCLADLKACKQSNIPIYSFSEHQRLDETKYLYGAAVIISK